MTDFNLTCNDIYSLLQESTPLLQTQLLSKLTPLIKQQIPTIVDQYIPKPSRNLFGIPLGDGIYGLKMDLYNKSKLELTSLITKLPDVLSSVLGDTITNINKNCTPNINKICNENNLYDILKPKIIEQLTLNLSKAAKVALVTTKIVDKLVDQLAIPYKKGLADVLNHKLYQDMTILSSCNYILTTCQSSFCNTGKNSTDDTKLSVTCSQINNLLTYLFNKKEFQTKFNQLIIKLGVSANISNIKDVCLQLKSLEPNPNKLADIVNENVNKTLDNLKYTEFKTIYKKYQHQLPSLISCICPDIIDIEPKQIDTNSKTSKYKIKNIVFVGILLFLLFLILYIIVLKHIPSLVIGLLLFAFFSVVYGLALNILIKINPICLLKSCSVDSTTFSSIKKGKYVGDHNFISLLQLSVELDVKDIDDIKITYLKCEGKICPFTNVVNKCKNNVIKLDLNSPSIYGYPLKGDCVDYVNTITGSDNLSIIKKLWLASHNNNYYLNVQIHVNESFTLNEIVSIKLIKQ
jgi:hypothetical protein